MDILFRLISVHRVTVSANTEKVLVMASVVRKDCNVLYFLWVKDAFANQLDIIDMKFTLVVFGVASSPLVLNATTRYHLEEYELTPSDLLKKVCRSKYVWMI